MLSDLRAGGRAGFHVPQAPPAQKILPGRTKSVTLKMYRRYFYLRYFLTKNASPSGGKEQDEGLLSQKRITKLSVYGSPKCVYLIEAGDCARGS
jgi:hypothetical protein